MVRFGGKNLHRAPEEIEVENFIGVKSYKARGKRVSTYEIDSLTWGTPYEVVGEVQTLAMQDGDDKSPSEEAGE